MLHNKLSNFILISGMTFISSNVFGISYSYKDALKDLSLNNANLKSAKIQKDVAISTSAVPSYILPTIGVTSVVYSGSQSYVPQYDPTDSTKQIGINLKKDWPTKVFDTLNFSAKLTIPGEIYISGEVASAAKKSAVYTYDKVVDAMDDALFETYWSLSSAIEALKVADTTFANADYVRRMTEEKYRDGLVSKTIYDSVLLNYSNSHLSQLSATNLVNKLCYSLEILTGRNINLDEIEIEKLSNPVALNLPSPETLYNKYAKQSLNMRGLVSSYEVAKAQSDATIASAYAPVISASVSYPILNLNRDKAVANIVGTEQVSFSINASLSLDSFIPGSSGWNSVKTAKANKEMAKLKLKEGWREHLIDIKNAVTQIKYSTNNLTVARDANVSAKNTYESSEKQFLAGLLSVNDWSTSRENYLSSQIVLINARISLLRDQNNLAKLLGITLDDLQRTFIRTTNDRKSTNNDKGEN